MDLSHLVQVEGYFALGDSIESEKISFEQTCARVADPTSGWSGQSGRVGLAKFCRVENSFVGSVGSGRVEIRPDVGLSGQSGRVEKSRPERKSDEDSSSSETSSSYEKSETSSETSS